jgi:flagellar motor switch protein FliN
MNSPLEIGRRESQKKDRAQPETELLTLEELVDSSTSAASVVVDRTSPLLDIKAQLQVCVGEATMTVGELLAAKQGHVIALDRGIDQVVDVLLEGRVVARGQLVAVDDVFGVRITELPLPLAP